jgi:hypothetical protein
MGKLTNLNAPKPLTEADMPPGMASDAETAAAITAHMNALDPHEQYLLPSEADAKYRHTNTAFFTSAPFPTANVAGNSIAFSWNSVQSGQGIAEFCNFAGLGGGDAFNFFRMGGNAVATPTLSHRVARIDVSGAYISMSDRRLKSHFSPAPGIEVLVKLRPLAYFHWECEGFDRLHQTLKIGKFGSKKVGFVAQDVQAHIPEAVSIPSSTEEPWGINYNCLLAVAVQAIKQQQELITELRARTTELETQVQALLKV